MERLDGSIKTVLRSAGVPDATALTAIVEAWPGCVGDAIARHAWPLRLNRDGTLRVACTSSTWAFELDRMGPDILESLRARLGDLAPASVRFAPGAVPAPGAEAPARAPERPRPGPAHTSEAARLTAAIEDPELREMAARAIAASLADHRDDRSF